MKDENLKTEENEILSRDDEKIRQMLGGLHRVDAPKDFDFRLKARIAKAQPEDFRTPRLFPILRYVAPLGLAVMVLAVLVVNGLYSVDDNSVPTVVENFAPQTNNVLSPSVLQPKEEIFTTDFVSVTANSENTAVNAAGKDKKETKIPSPNSVLAANTGRPKINKPPTENNGGGSLDSASKTTSVLVPREFGQNKPIAVKDVLSIIGIEASFAGSKWKVSSVREKSMADNAGVKANDIIEAIDGNRLAGETITSTNNFKGNLTVVRGGERLEIKLQNK